MPGKLRNVIEEPLFAIDLEQIEPNAKRADEFVDGVKLRVARNPEAGIQASPDSPVWCILSNDKSGIQPLILFYTFDDDNVYLLSIRKTETHSEG